MGKPREDVARQAWTSENYASDSLEFRMLATRSAVHRRIASRPPSVQTQQSPRIHNYR